MTNLLYAILLLSQATSAKQPEKDPWTDFRSVTYIGQVDGVAPKPAKLPDLAKFAKLTGEHPVGDRLVLSVAGNSDAILVSKDLPEFAHMFLVNDAIRALGKIPEKPLQTLGDYPPALQAYVSESARATLPIHEIPTEGLPTDTKFLIRTSNRIRLEDSNGDSVELSFDDQTIGGLDKERTRALYKSLGSTPIRLTKTEKQINEAMQRSIREFELVGAARGYRMLILKNQSFDTNLEVQNVAAAKQYADLMRKLRTQAAASMAPLIEDMKKRFPHLIDAYPVGSQVSGLPKNTVEGLKLMLSTLASLGGKVPSDRDAFLARARIVDSQPGITLGFAMDPDGSVLGVRLWPR
jgi:hypothetical protein